MVAECKIERRECEYAEIQAGEIERVNFCPRRRKKIYRLLLDVRRCIENLGFQAHPRYSVEVMSYFCSIEDRGRECLIGKCGPLDKDPPSGRYY